MSKLLQTLDQAVQADLDSVAESVLDKNYMGQLVAVQHKRGASGGLVFAKALGLSLDLGIECFLSKFMIISVKIECICCAPNINVNRSSDFNTQANHYIISLNIDG